MHRLRSAPLLALLLCGCQPPSTSPDAQSPTPTVEVLSASGTGAVEISVSGQRIALTVATETRPGADPCVRGSVAWGPVLLPFERGCAAPPPTEPSGDSAP